MWKWLWQKTCRVCCSQTEKKTQNCAAVVRSCVSCSSAVPPAGCGCALLYATRNGSKLCALPYYRHMKDDWLSDLTRRCRRRFFFFLDTIYWSNSICFLAEDDCYACRCTTSGEVWPESFRGRKDFKTAQSLGTKPRRAKFGSLPRTLYKSRLPRVLPIRIFKFIANFHDNDKNGFI